MDQRAKIIATSCGILGGLGVVLLSWWLWIFNGKKKSRLSMDSIYRRYISGPVDSVVCFFRGIFFTALMRVLRIVFALLF